jgi:hypothetical protein
MPAAKKAPAEPITSAQITKWQAMAADSGNNLVAVSHEISREIRGALRERGVRPVKDALYTVSGESISENRVVADGLSMRRLELPTTTWSDPHVWQSKSTKIHYVVKEGEDQGLER